MTDKQTEIKEVEKLVREADKELEMAKQAWKFFLKAHADECDTDAVIDEIVDKCQQHEQARVEKLLEEIENIVGVSTTCLDPVKHIRHELKAIKKREGIDVSPKS